MDISEPGALIEDVGGVAKEVVSLLTFSEGLGTILETVMGGGYNQHLVLGYLS